MLSSFKSWEHKTHTSVPWKPLSLDRLRPEERIKVNGGESLPLSSEHSQLKSRPNLTVPEFPGFQNGGKHEGEYPVACWNAYSVHHNSVRNTFDYLNRINRMPHYIWDPFNGDLFQCLSLDVAGRQYGRDINRGGNPCIQVAVCAYGNLQITDTLCKGLGGLLETLRGLGVPDLFPLGVPSPYGRSYGLLRAFPEPGHYAGNQIDPSLDGIGRLNVHRFFEDKENSSDE
jgi:hypothetical protein